MECGAWGVESSAQSALVLNVLRLGDGGTNTWAAVPLQHLGGHARPPGSQQMAATSVAKSTSARLGGQLEAKNELSQRIAPGSPLTLLHSWWIAEVLCSRSKRAGFSRGPRSGPREARLGHHLPGRFSVVLPVYWHRSIWASRLRGHVAKGEVTEMKDGIAIMLGLLGVALAILIHGYLGRYQVTAGEQIVVRMDGLTGQACFYNYPDSKFERCTPTSD
jgi:hypothetical protein